MIHIWRDFAGTPEQLFRAHTDPELFGRWVGPGRHAASRSRSGTPRDGGSWRFTGSDATATCSTFRGCFHTVRPDRIVQTFTWEGMPDGVALETLTFEDLGDGRTRLHAQSLCDSFEDRDAWLRSGMETGVNDGYAAIDRLLADGVVSSRTAGPARRHRLVRRRLRPALARHAGLVGRGTGVRLGGPRLVVHLVEWLPAFVASGATSGCRPGRRPPTSPSPPGTPTSDAVQVRARRSVDRRTGSPTRTR